MSQDINPRYKPQDIMPWIDWYVYEKLNKYYIILYSKEFPENNDQEIV